VGALFRGLLAGGGSGGNSPQYGGLGPGFEQLLDRLAGEGVRYRADERSGQAVRAAAGGGDGSPGKAQADALPHRLRCGAQGELFSTAMRE
jgi:hypothetical protein